MLSGVDVSHYQAGQVGDLVRHNEFVIVKASEGLHYNDLSHGAFVAAARKAGRLVGHYHYAWPENDPRAEAKHFVAAARPAAGELVALDMERASSVSWERRVAYAVAWLSYVRAATKASPALYVNQSWARELLAAATLAQKRVLLAAPLWLAEWDHRGNPHDVGWAVWTVQQFAGTTIDLDVFNGTPAVWRALGVPARGSIATKVAGGVVGAIIGAGACVGGVIPHRPVPVPPPVVKHEPTRKPVVVKPRPVVKPKPKPKPVAKPGRHRAVVVTVRSGDTLGGIARAHHTTVPVLVRLNRLAHPDHITVGQRIRLP